MRAEQKLDNWGGTEKNLGGLRKAKHQNFLIFITKIIEEITLFF
jgi:hypothetical protein